MRGIADCLLFAAVASLAGAIIVHEDSGRARRPAQSGAVIDSEFNNPNTVRKLKESTAPQTFSPSYSEKIEDQIHSESKQAVQSPAKNPSSRRRHNDIDIAERRQDKRRRIDSTVLDKREQQRIYREQLERRKFEQLRDYQQRQMRPQDRHHHDPLGLNALANLFLGHHGIFGGHGHGGLVKPFQGVGNVLGHWGNGGHGSHGSHGSHGGHGGHGSYGIHGIHGHGSESHHTYQVYETIDESDSPFKWPGWAAFSNIFNVHSFSKEPIENKIAPKEAKPGKPKYGDKSLRHKVAPTYFRDDAAQFRDNFNSVNEIPQGNSIDDSVPENKISFPDN